MTGWNGLTICVIMAASDKLINGTEIPMVCQIGKICSNELSHYKNNDFFYSILLIKAFARKAMYSLLELQVFFHNVAFNMAVVA